MTSSKSAEYLHDITHAEIALLLESMPVQQRDALWPLIEPAELSAILLELQDDVSDARQVQGPRTRGNRRHRRIATPTSTIRPT